jgi:amino acid adenylation domain-containing protein
VKPGPHENQAEDSTRTVYPRDACVHELFEEQVKLTPFAIAVNIGEKQLTYAELNLAAENAARKLRQLGVKADTLVGLCLPRSFSLIIGLLGILKAGGAYVGLNADDPREHLTSIIKDTKIRVLLTQEHLLSQLPFESGCAVCFDSDGSITTIISYGDVDSTGAGSGQENHESIRPASALSLAYVSFTSGSTGPPKGVCITHRGVVRLVKNTNYVSLTQAEVFLQWSPISFDASTFEVWACLLNGARLVLFPPEPFSHAILRHLIRSQGITTLWLTTGLFQQLAERDVDALRGIRQLLVGGDVLSVPIVQTAAEQLEGCQLINAYGPTENTTFTCCYPIRLPLPSTSSVPIGRPISNTCVYILDSVGKRVAFGEPGELAIGGDGLARGYLNLPAVTAERFITVRFDNGPSLRLYRSGDRVRYLPDRNLEFLGRIDRQIKVRGFRVEPTAIEATLARHDCVHTAAVITRGSADRRRLEAYILPKSGATLTNRALRDFLRSHLPNYMLPNDFFFVREMPLTRSGKVDSRALFELGQAELEGERQTAFLRTRTEKVLAELWGEALGRREVDIDETFVDAGGDSLQAIGLVLSVERKLNKRLPFAAVETGTIRSLANSLDRLPASQPEVNQRALLMSDRATIGYRAPLFFVPGQAGDDLHCYFHVIADLPNNQPVYGLQPRGLIGEQECDTIEQTAAHYLQQLHQSQPSGPYFLCGFCFGGLVAFEMAQQLQAVGEQVAFLGILDYRLNSEEPATLPRSATDLVKLIRNYIYAFADFFEAPKYSKAFIRRALTNLARYYRRILRRNDSQFLETVGQPPADYCTQPVSPADMRRLKIHLGAWRRYQPRTYTGPVTLFRQRRLPLLYPYDDTLGWSKIAVGALGVQKIPGPGFQGSMLRPPYASILAQRLNRWLELAQKTYSPSGLPFIPSNSMATSRSSSM